MTLLWSYNSRHDATGSVYGSVHILVIHFCYSCPSYIKRETLSGQVVSKLLLFFMMQATVDIMDTMNLMQPIKKDGHSQKGLSLDKVSCRTSPINSFVILLRGTGGSAANFSSISCCCTDGMC